MASGWDQYVIDKDYLPSRRAARYMTLTVTVI